MESYDLYSETDSQYIGRRKGRKLLAEKRRRARINQCLNQIKDIVSSTEIRNDPNYEKMEKAEILESTVDYLRNVRKINTVRQQVKETVQVRFQQGFSRCAEEILTYIQYLPGVSDNVQHQLRKHLSGRLTHIQQEPVTSSTQSATSFMNRCHEIPEPYPSRFPHPAAHEYMNSHACTSPVKKDSSLNDSGYGSSPYSMTYEPDRKEQRHPEKLPVSELGTSYSRKEDSEFSNSRVSAWVQSTLPNSRHVKIEQQVLWRPW